MRTFENINAETFFNEFKEKKLKNMFCPEFIILMKQKYLIEIFLQKTFAKHLLPVVKILYWKIEKTTKAFLKTDFQAKNPYKRR